MIFLKGHRHRQRHTHRQADKQTPEQLEARRKGIGASEAAAVLGLNPHMSPIDVWVSKVHPELQSPRDDEDFLNFGTEVEASIERRYIRDTGNWVYRPNPAIVIHPKYPELICTPDGLCDSPEKICVEYKFERFSDNFGDPGTDEIPEHFLIQGAHQMACTGRERVDFGVLHGAPPIRVYRAHRDLELERELIERLRAWWADYVLKDVEPPIDASSGWGKYLKAKFPRHEGEMLRITDGEEDSAIRDAVESLKRIKIVIEKHTETMEQYKNIIRAFIGENPGIYLPDGSKVTWKKDKDSIEDVTDWETIARHLAAGIDREYVEKLIASNTTFGVVRRKGARKLILTEKK